MASLNFSINDAPVSSMNGARGQLPPGDYEMIVTRSDIKDTKAGTGQFIELEMQVVVGEHSGRRHWERLNISNPSKTAEDIAKAQLAALCTAVNLTELNDTEDLHDRPFIASIEKDRKDPERNRVVGYSAAAAVPAPARVVAGGGGRPWQK